MDEKVLSPATCVRVSILDFGHPLRGGSSMGQGSTTKDMLCFAFIHLGEGMGRREERKREPMFTTKEKKYL